MLNLKVLEPTPLKGDNTGSLSIAETNKVSTRTKHLDVSVRNAQELIARKEIVAEHVPGTKNLADLFTKILPVAIFTRLSQSVINIIS